MKQNVELTPEQINQIIDAINNKGCPYLDLQSEMVDHIACAVEQKLEEYPNLTFDSALKSVLRKKPATGFYNVVNQRERMLKAYWWKILFKEIVGYFTIPKILLLSIAMYLSYLLILTFEDICIWGISILLTLGTLLGYHNLGISTWRNDRIKDNFLYRKMLKSCVAMVGNPIGVILYLWFFLELNYGIWIYVISFLITICFVWLIVILTFIPEALEKEYKSKHSHLSLS